MNVSDLRVQTIPDSLVTFVKKLLPKSPLVYRYETVVSKEPVGQGHLRVTEYKRANYTGHKRDNILSHSLFTICKMVIVLVTVIKV